MISIVLIDDHSMLTNTIGAWLEATGRFTIAGTAASLVEARALLKKLDPMPHIVILDISLRSTSRADVQEDRLTFIPELEKICEERKTPVPGVLVCTMYEDPFFVRRAMDLGARAYVAKSAVAEEIITAIDAILAGGTYTSVKSKIKKQKKAFLALTRRENEIVALVKQSLTNQQIVKMLELSNRTLENHLKNIYEKTGVMSRKELFNL
jgi:NarL family two-component system response regulator LiaR